MCVNGDGLPDVVVTRITYPPAFVSHPVGIFLADGRGGFSDGSTMWDGPPSQTEWGRQILIADFNGDRRNVIFVADTGYDAPPFPPPATFRDPYRRRWRSRSLSFTHSS